MSPRFNPRTRTGCDITALRNGSDPVQFQPTHPHGVRHHVLRYLASGRCSFNPRTRTGCDGLFANGQVFLKRFQPTHPHGVRPCFTVSCKRLMCFNPRTRTGCDEFLIWSGFEILCFNPRTRPGSDRVPSKTMRTGQRSFNPRTRTGCDATASLIPV